MGSRGDVSDLLAFLLHSSRITLTRNRNLLALLNRPCSMYSMRQQLRIDNVLRTTSSHQHPVLPMSPTTHQDTSLTWHYTHDSADSSPEKSPNDSHPQPPPETYSP
jgi:hypothetical protein